MRLTKRFVTLKNCEDEAQPINEKKNNDLRIAISILSEATQRGYERIRKTLLSQFKTLISKENLPLFHNLTKSRPEVESLTIKREPKLSGYEKEAEKESPLDLNATTEDSANLQRVAPALMSEQDEEAALYLEGLKGDRNNIQGARLKGDYSNVIEKLKKN